MYVFCFHTFFVLLYQFLRNRTQEQYYFFSIHTRRKRSTRKRMKKSHEYQGIDPEYVTGQLLLRQFRRLIYAPSRKS